MIFSIYHPESSRNYIRFDEFKFVHLYDLYSYLFHFFGIPQLEKVQNMGISRQEVGYAKAPNYED